MIYSPPMPEYLRDHYRRLFAQWDLEFNQRKSK